MDIKLQIAFFILTGIAVIIFAVWIITTERRLKRFFLGKKAKDLEDTIMILEQNISNLKKSRDDMQRDMSVMQGKLRKSIRGLETIRFNPFPDQGSNQSFAVGMLNEDGDGVVLSSLYSRDRMSVFAKPVKNGKSEYELSNEERDVLDKAEIK
jgi:hypothetical protein